MLGKVNEPTKSELNLRAMWDQMGILPQKQDEILAEIDARAQPGAMVGPFVIIRTPEDAAQEIAMLRRVLENSITLLEACRRNSCKCIPPAVLVNQIDESWEVLKNGHK